MNQFGLTDKYIRLIQSVFWVYPEIETAWIYGSRARGDEKKFSDADLAIDVRGLDYAQYVEILARLRDLPIPYEIDLVNLADLKNAELKKNILRERKVFYQKDK